jgi:hypothetical protein
VELDVGRLFLKANEPYGTIGHFSTDVFGTADGHEKVFLQSDALVVFDPSFNRGGDEIVIAGNANLFKGARSGSNLLITNDLGAQIFIPAGTVGAKVTFDNGSFLLAIKNGAIQLGDQVMDATATQFTALGTGIAQAPAALHVEAPPADDGGSAATPQAPESAAVAVAAPLDPPAHQDAATPHGSGLLFLEAGVTYGHAETGLGSSSFSFG